MLKNFRWTRALVSLIVGSIIILTVGIPLAINYGVLAYLSFSGVVAALLAVYVATRSLQLTRETQRPFLNVGDISVVWSDKDDQTGNVNYIITHINNTGVFPADKVNIEFKIWPDGVDGQKKILKVREEIPSILFPGEELNNLMFEEGTSEKLIIKRKGKIQLQIQIQYCNKLLDKKHKTIRSYIVQYAPTAYEPPIPNPKEDYWD
jgi:hypothetical protein